VDAEEEMRRRVHWMDVQERSVLPALLFTVVHGVDREATAMKLVVVQCRRDARDNRESLGMFERQPQGSLAPHAHGKEGGRGWRKVQAALEVRQDVVEEITLGRQLRVKIGTDTIGPPRITAWWTDAGEAVFLQQLTVNWVRTQGLLANRVQEQNAEA